MDKLIQVSELLGQPQNIQVNASPLTKQADFMISIRGHGMEPDYPDGSIVLVSQKTTVNIGDVGIFAVNGEIVIKERGESELICKNKSYPNLPIKGSIICLGKVIGIYDDHITLDQ